MDMIFCAETEIDKISGYLKFNGVSEALKTLDSYAENSAKMISVSVLEKDLKELSTYFETAREWYERYKLQPFAMDVHLMGSILEFAMMFRKIDTIDRILNGSNNIRASLLAPISYCEGLYNNQINGGKNAFSFLYDAKGTIPDEVRHRILDTLAAEKPEDFMFPIYRITSISNVKVQKQILEDYKRYPNLFEQFDTNTRIDVDALLFLMKIYKKDPKEQKRLLAQEVLNQRFNSGLDEYSKQDVKRFAKSVCKINECGDGSEEFTQSLLEYALCRQVVFLNAMKSEGYGFSSGKLCDLSVEEKKELIDDLNTMIVTIAPPKTMFEEMIEDILDNGMSITNIYDMAYMLYDEKLPLKINIQKGDDYAVSHMFRCETDMDYYLENNRSSVSLHLLQIAESIGKIQYTYEKEIDLKKNIGRFITKNARVLKESFLSFLEKGLIPENCIEYALGRALKNKECCYMIPYLILLKNGGVKTYGE